MTKEQAEAVAGQFACRIAPIYQVLGWEWVNRSRPPGPDQIYACLVDLIEQCQPDNFTETGGLRVTRDGADYMLEFRMECYGLPDVPLA